MIESKESSAMTNSLTGVKTHCAHSGDKSKSWAQQIHGLKIIPTKRLNWSSDPAELKRLGRKDRAEKV